MIFNMVGNGGAGLNFKVVGGTTQPSSTSENTIWVNTDTEITGWSFSATQPTSPTAGMVWFKTGTSTPIEFNALKKNEISVYPISAYQYVSGAWVQKTAQICQGSAWDTWVDPIIVVPNNTTYAASAWTESNVGITVTETYTKASYSDWDNSSANMAYINIDVTDYTSMELVGTCTAGASDSGTSSVNLKAGLFNGTSLTVGYSTSLTEHNVNTINKTYDISNVTGTVRFGFYFQVSSTSSYDGNFNMTSVIFR